MTYPTKEAQLRAERLAKALRANLGRRKSQARSRDSLPAGGSDAQDSAAGDSDAAKAGGAEMSQGKTG